MGAGGAEIMGLASPFLKESGKKVRERKSSSPMKATKIREVPKLNTDLSIGNFTGTQGSSALASGAGEGILLSVKKIGGKKGKKKAHHVKSD